VSGTPWLKSGASRGGLVREQILEEISIGQDEKAEGVKSLQLFCCQIMTPCFWFLALRGKYPLDWWCVACVAVMWW